MSSHDAVKQELVAKRARVEGLMRNVIKRSEEVKALRIEIEGLKDEASLQYQEDFN